MSKFRVTYRRIVTTVTVEGQFEVDVEAPTPEQAQAFIANGCKSGFGANLLSRNTSLSVQSRKTTEVLGADSSETSYGVMRVEAVS